MIWFVFVVYVYYYIPCIRIRVFRLHNIQLIGLSGTRLIRFDGHFYTVAFIEDDAQRLICKHARGVMFTRDVRG